MALSLKFNEKYIDKYIGSDEITAEIIKHKQLFDDGYACKIGPDDRKGWFKVDNNADENMLKRIHKVADKIRSQSEVLVVIGIGGSNRGSMAAVECLKYAHPDSPEIIWAGNNVSATAIERVMDRIGNRSVSVYVIAKDFNTVEPGLAFRMFRQYLKQRYGDEYKERVTVCGSEGKGNLLELSQKYGFGFLPFPEEVGGRYCILTPVGLLPCAVAGIDIDVLVQSARDTEKYLKTVDAVNNPAVRYAVARNLLMKKGFYVESMVVNEPDLEFFARWWLQEFGETEGKIQECIYPDYYVNSEDLHSIGQYVQQGRRFITETYLRCFKTHPDKKVPSSDVEDGFGYLEGKPYDSVNRAVYNGSLKAHYDDGVPCLEFICPDNPDEKLFGELFYFFLFAVYMSANYIGVNPFNQDGVENYKKNMYDLLEKFTKK